MVEPLQYLVDQRGRDNYLLPYRDIPLLPGGLYSCYLTFFVWSFTFVDFLVISRVP